MLGPSLRPGPGPIVVPAAVYDVDVLRTALWRCYLGAELPLLAVCSHSKCDSKFAFPGMTEPARSKQYAKERHAYVAYWHLPSGDLVSVG